MTSEIRANTIKNRVGLGTVSYTNTGIVVSGIVTANSFSGPYNGTDIVGTGLTLTSTDTGSSAGPELKLFRNSASPADADYLGQLKFAGESDTGVERNYAKITGKILDASNGTEDGIIEIAHIKAGSQNISARFRSDSLQLLNDTNLTVDGELSIGHNNPAYQLDILKATGGTSLYIKNTAANNINNSIRIQNNSGGNLYLGVFGASAGAYGQLNANDAFLGSAEDLSIHSISNTGVIKFGIGASGPSEKMRITSSGTVNIGANFSQTTYPFSVQGSSNTTAIIKCSGNDTANIFFDANRNGANSNISVISGLWNGTNVANIRFLTGDDTSNKDDGQISFRTASAGIPEERLRISSTGIVGIGTNNPTAGKLHIDGDVDTDLVMLDTYTAGNYAQVRSNNNAGIRIRGGGSYGGGMIDFGAGLRGTDPGVIKFHAGTDVTANNKEYMRLQANGEVAMKSSGDPTDALAGLHVQNGTFRVSQSSGPTSEYFQITTHTHGQDGDRHLMSGYSNGTVYSYITKNGNIGSLHHHYAGRTRTDANSPTNYYSHGAFGFYCYSGRTDDTANYRSSAFIRAWDQGDSGDRNVIYYVDSGSDTTTADFDQHQYFGIKANGMAQFGNNIFAGRVESDEGTPNSVYRGGSGQTILVYPGSSSYYTRMDARTTDNSDRVFAVDSGGGVVIKFESDGDGRFDGGADIGNASDYAEYFEWVDGNTSNADRRGITVVLDGEKIRPATSSDDTSKIIGVVSANPAVVGDSAWSEWQLAHLKDAYGSWVTKDEEFLVWNKFGTFIDTDGVKKPNPQPDINDYNRDADYQVLVSEIEAEKAKGNVPQAAIDQNLRVTKASRTYNPDYDKTRDYVPRSHRKEWDAIGLMGKLVVRRGQPIGANWILMKSNVGTDPNDSNIILDKYLVR